jgi:hypothetical protein
MPFTWACIFTLFPAYRSVTTPSSGLQKSAGLCINVQHMDTGITVLWINTCFCGRLSLDYGIGKDDVDPLQGELWHPLLHLHEPAASWSFGMSICNCAIQLGLPLGNNTDGSLMP